MKRSVQVGGGDGPRGQRRRPRRWHVEPLEPRQLLSATIYVDANAPGPTYDGTGWSTAYTDLQQALAVAVSGDRIDVADGTYKPTMTADRTISFQIGSGVGVYGGYAGFGAANPDARDVSAYPTTLSGDIGASNDVSDNSYHVVSSMNAGAVTTLDGLVITGGNANDLLTEPTGHGGGVYCDHSSLTVTGCVFNSNSAAFGGGIYSVSSATDVENTSFSANYCTQEGAGLYVQGSTASTVANCTFSENGLAPDDPNLGSGGGIFDDDSVIQISDCVFSGNRGYHGGAFVPRTAVPAVLTRCSFSGNTATSDGGAICDFGQYGWLTLQSCTFDANTAPSGGAIYFISGGVDSVNNCTFRANHASVNGGALYHSSAGPTYTNCTFVGNTAGSKGGASYNAPTSGPNWINCTISANTAGSTGGAMYNDAFVSLTNTILWHDSAATGAELYRASGTTTVTYSDVEGGVGGIGNVAADPLFARAPSPGPDGLWGNGDDDYGDLHVAAASVAVDAASNSAVPSAITTDLGDGPRFIDVTTIPDSGSGTAPIVDMGAFESSPSLSAFAGAPYVVLAGNSLTLAGRGASDTPGPVSYAWEWTGDGQFDDGATASPVFPAALLQASAVIPVQLRVTDGLGRTATSATTVSVLPRVVYVDATAAAGGNGATWATAKPDLAATWQQAIPGQTIRVAHGTYMPTSTTNRTLSFALKSGVAIYGGYAGLGAANSDARDTTAFATILSGDIGTVGSTTDNSYHVVSAFSVDASAILDGVTITRGNANGSQTTTTFPNYGGGLYTEGASPSVNNCLFVTNRAAYGGGVASNGGAPTLTGCRFLANVATTGGGATRAFVSSTPKYVNCLFVGNAASSFGGVCATSSSANATYINCTMTANSSPSGRTLDSSAGSVTAFNCVMWGNTGSTTDVFVTGGATASVTYCDVQSSYTGTGNISADPLFARAASAGADGTWGTTDDNFGDLRLSLGSACVDSGSNAAVPAGVTTDLAGNQRIFDFPGVRDPGAIVDMGAYELGFNLGPIHAAAGQALALPAGGYAFTAEQLTIDAGGSLNVTNDQLIVTATTSSIRSYLKSGQLFTTMPGGMLGYLDLGGGRTEVRNTLPGDTNLDGKVDVTDLGNLASSYGTSTGAAWVQGDSNYDGAVDVTDLGNLASNYGASLPASPAAASMNDGGTIVAKPAARLVVHSAVSGTSGATLGVALHADSASPFGGSAERLYLELEQVIQELMR